MMTEVKIIDKFGHPLTVKYEEDYHCWVVLLDDDCSHMSYFVDKDKFVKELFQYSQHYITNGLNIKRKDGVLAFAVVEPVAAVACYVYVFDPTDLVEFLYTVNGCAV